ncbi:MAG TPA: low affinity iron permease family protein [Candidatus Limnocylindrales bacterium]|jgi:low affinity Fe/Cu permease
MTAKASVVPARSGFPRRAAPSSRERFRAAAQRITVAAGSWQFFVGSVVAILIWAALGPVMRFTDTWQLLVNTPTTVLTFLLGILILMEANRQAKESRIVHEELLASVRQARNELVDIDELTEDQLDRIEADIKRRARRKPATPRRRGHN